jgi:hypothetical protein
MKLPYSGELDDNELNKAVAAAKEYSQASHALIETAREYRRMRQRVSMPPGTRKTSIEVRNAFVFDMVHRMSSAVISNFPWIQAVADDITQESENRASKKERHSTAALKRAAFEAGTHQEPFARTTWAQMGDGMGVYKWLYRPDRWAPWPKRRGKSPSQYMKSLQQWKMSRFPFMWRSVDPLTYFPLYGDEDKVFVAEISQRRRTQLDNAFGEDKISSVLELVETRESAGNVEFQELMTATHIYYRVNNKTIHKVEHKQPFIHYYEARGITTESNTPGEDSLPLPFGLLKFSPLLDMMFTVIAEGFMVAGIPTPFLKVDANSPEYARLFGPDGRPISQTIALGQINPVQGDLTLPLSQAMPSLLNDSLKAIMGLAEATMLPPALRGQGIGSDWSGYLANTVLHVVLSLLAGPLYSHESAFAQMIRNYWWTIQHKLETDVWVWAREKSRRGRWAPLGPQDIRDFYEVYVHMRPSLPRDDAQRAQTGLQLWQSGAISLRTFLTQWLEMDYPDEEEERIMLERLFKSPEIDSLRLAALLRRLAPESPLIQEIAQTLAPVLETQAGGTPGAQPGMQEAAPFAAGALGGGLPGGGGAVPFVGGRPSTAGMAPALPTGPQMGP